MNKLKYTSISTRISLLLGAIILITMIAFSILSLWKQKQDAVESVNRSTLLLSQTTEKILRLSMLRNRRDDISKAIKNIVGEEGIRSVRILNHKGIIMYSSQPSEIDEHISRTNKLCSNCHSENNGSSRYSVSSFYSYHFDDRNDIIYSSLPIYNSPSCYESDCHATGDREASMNPGISKYGIGVNPVHDSSETILGFIEIEVSARKIMANLDRSRVELILLTILMALAASTAAYFSIRRLVGIPVKKLVEGTRRVAQGDFSHEIQPGEAELGVLADSFNQMQKDLVSAQSQLIESEKLASVGKLADEIANEINNPLTGIIIHTESLIEQFAREDSNRADLETILREALKIRESTRHILSLSEKGKPSFVPVEVDGIIRHSISVVEKFASFRNIRIVSEKQRFLPKVVADPGLLEQVFVSLLLISSEGMAEGGIVIISTSYLEKEGKVEIRFTDAGKGITENVLHALSEQSAGTETGDLERTRTSFSVCRNIITLHKGRIYASSGTGTAASLVIELPV